MDPDAPFRVDSAASFRDLDKIAFTDGDATVFFKDEWSFHGEFDLEFKAGSLNTIFGDNNSLPYDAIASDEAVYFELYGGVVSVNRDAVDHGALILNPNNQEKNYIELSDEWTVSPSDWFTPYTVVTSANAPATQPEDYFSYFVGSSRDDVIYSYGVDAHGEIISQSGRGAGYHEDYVAAGPGMTPFMQMVVTLFMQGQATTYFL